MRRRQRKAGECEDEGQREREGDERRGKRVQQDKAEIQSEREMLILINNVYRFSFLAA